MVSRAPGRKVRLVGVACAAAAALLGLGRGGAAADHRPAHVEFSYASTAVLEKVLERHPARLIRVLAPLRVAEVRPVGDARGWIAAVQRERGVSAVHVTARTAAAEDPSLALGAVSTPNGGAYEWQWYATRENEVPSAVAAAARSVTIAVLDTGADVAAPDLAPKISATYDVRTRGRRVSDTAGHGTFVASLAAGSTTNGAGVAGFGGAARLLVVKVADSERLTDVDVADGILYAVKKGARIINLSVAGRTPSPLEAAAVRYAAARGVLLVAAAGNDALGGNPPEYPAALLQPIGSNGAGGLGLAVGASDGGGARAPFSGYGSWLSLVAPGENVFGALSSASSAGSFPRSLLGGGSGAYGFASGTSYAAPQVAGAAALVWAANPRLSARGVARILERTASGPGSWTPELGYGVLDVGAAVRAALETR